MAEITYKNAGQQAFLDVLRELVRAYQAFTFYDAMGLREIKLTSPQADVIFTLGNTHGMTFKEIGDHTLITKGTLTGVIDRLETKGLVKRIPGLEDKRCTRVELTLKGNKVFQIAFPKHVSFLKKRFDRLDEKDRADLVRLLKKLKNIF